MEEARLSRQLEKIANHLKLVLADVEELAQELISDTQPREEVSDTSIQVRSSPDDERVDKASRLDQQHSRPSVPSKSRVTLSKLFTANLLKPGDRLILSRYERVETAYITNSGSIEWKGQEFKTPSGAGQAAIQYLGGPKTAPNGWIVWLLIRTNQTLAEVREEYLNKYT